MFHRFLKFSAVLVIFGVLTTVDASGQKPANTAALKAELRSLYEKLLVASKNKDKATLTKILTDNYSQVTADGRVRTKPIRLAETMNPEDKTEILALESFDLFLYNNAAVARCLVRNKGASRGESYDVKILSTATFVKDGKVWKIAATHLTYPKK